MPHLRLRVGAALCAIALVATSCAKAPAEKADAQRIKDQIGALRSLADAERALVTATLARQIQTLPAGVEKVSLALSLANLSTEGDFGRDTLQAVATTLQGAVRETPPDVSRDPKNSTAYVELAQLAKYEHINVTLDLPAYHAAMTEVDRVDALRASADFTLTDLEGKTWTRSALKDRVVLVNFWATWCPPCRKEMPDLDALYQQFKGEGFVVLSISDEPEATVKPFLADHHVSYPVLLDPGHKIGDVFKIESIPKSFVYDRTGRLVAQSIDMRTRPQFLALLAAAGLR